MVVGGCKHMGRRRGKHSGRRRFAADRVNLLMDAGVGDEQRRVALPLATKPADCVTVWFAHPLRHPRNRRGLLDHQAWLGYFTVK